MIDILTQSHGNYSAVEKNMHTFEYDILKRILKFYVCQGVIFEGLVVQMTPRPLAGSDIKLIYTSRYIYLIYIFTLTFHLVQIFP